MGLALESRNTDLLRVPRGVSFSRKKPIHVNRTWKILFKHNNIYQKQVKQSLGCWKKSLLYVERTMGKMKTLRRFIFVQLNMLYVIHLTVNIPVKFAACAISYGMNIVLFIRPS